MRFGSGTQSRAPGCGFRIWRRIVVEGKGGTSVRTWVYIDGFNLYFSAVKDTPLRWLDPHSLAGVLFPKNQIEKLKVFTAKVQNRPSDADQRLRQLIYWRALRTIPGLEIIEGDFRTREVRAAVVSPPPKTVLVYKTEEKGSDVNLASHLLLDGFRDAYECAIVISGDSDLVTPIRMVRDHLRKPVGVLNPQRLTGPDKRPERKSAGLKGAATFYKNGVTWSQLQDSQFPDILTDSHGTFHKPGSW